MRKLPDGSGCFTNIIGPREPGLMNWLKYEKIGRARRWLFVWRMYNSARILSAEEGRLMSPWRCLVYAVTC